MLLDEETVFTVWIADPCSMGSVMHHAILSINWVYFFSGPLCIHYFVRFSA